MVGSRRPHGRPWRVPALSEPAAREPQPVATGVAGVGQASDEAPPVPVDPARDYAFYDMLPAQEVEVPDPRRAGSRGLRAAEGRRRASGRSVQAGRRGGQAEGKAGAIRSGCKDPARFSLDDGKRGSGFASARSLPSRNSRTSAPGWRRPRWRRTPVAPIAETPLPEGVRSGSRRRRIRRRSCRRGSPGCLSTLAIDVVLVALIILIIRTARSLRGAAGPARPIPVRHDPVFGKTRRRARDNEAVDMPSPPRTTPGRSDLRSRATPPETFQHRPVAAIAVDLRDLGRLRCVGISSGTVDEFDSAVLATLVPAVKALASQRVAAQQRRYPTSDEKISGSRARLLDRAGIT